MANVCLPPAVADKFKQAFVKGELDPAKLSAMSSEERHTFFEGFSDKPSATTINSLFESKLLLKNQQKGMVTWAKSVTGMSTDAKKDIISRIEKMNRVLDPGEKEQFLKDLAETKLGVGVSREEAGNIAKLSKQIEEAKAKQGADGSWPSEADRMAYGRAAVKMTSYVNELKVGAQKLRLGDVKSNPLGVAGKLFDRAAGNAKAINASLDDSAIFRQGWKTLWTNPALWQKNARQTFIDGVRQFGGKNVMDEVHADIISRPNYERMVKAKLDVANLEEAFPTTAPEKIPGLGRLYKASEAAYTGFVQRQRADIFDKYMQIAEKSGVNINDKTELEAIGKLVNSITGRGNLGRAEPVAGMINNVFFSPRFLKSNLDLITQPLGAGGAKTAFARKQAAVNLVKVVSGSAAVMAIANAALPHSVEFDPRSSDFGKIRVGNTRFDVTGGSGSIATLAARLAPLLIGKAPQSKSATTGEVTSLNSGKFGATTGLDLVVDFFGNKASPVGTVVLDMLKGQDHNGNKPTVGGEAAGLFTPMGLKNYQELQKDPHAANTLVAMIADGLGISANTYGASSGTWQKSTGKELTSFKTVVGTQKFNEASKQYDTKFNNWLQATRVKPEYTSKNADDQKKLIEAEKAKIQKDIFDQYNFHYKKAKGSSVDKSLL